VEDAGGNGLAICGKARGLPALFAPILQEAAFLTTKEGKTALSTAQSFPPPWRNCAKARADGGRFGVGYVGKTLVVLALRRARDTPSVIAASFPHAPFATNAKRCVDALAIRRGQKTLQSIYGGYFLASALIFYKSRIADDQWSPLHDVSSRPR